MGQRPTRSRQHTYQCRGRAALDQYSDLYQINAKAEGEPSVAITAGPMMQSLLEDRFKLKIHRETREGPAFALVVAKGGLRLPPAKVACIVQVPGQPRPPLQPGQTPPPFCGWGSQTRDAITVRGS